MAIQKSKTLASGATGDYWKITDESYDKLTGKCTWYITLFTDKSFADADAPSLCLHKPPFTYMASKMELQGNRTALGYTQIKLQAAAVVPNIGGSGTHVFDPDLVGGIDV